MENILKNYIEKLDELYITKIEEMLNNENSGKKECIIARQEFKDLLKLKNLYETLFKGIDKDYVSLSIFLIFKNQALFPNGGTFRNTSAIISGSTVKCSEHRNISKELTNLNNEFVDLKNKAKNCEDKEEFIKEVLELKAKVVKIHPFPDGNGRCSRALVDCLLMLAGLEVTPYNKLDYNEHKKYIDAMAKMLEENNSNDLMEFYKGHITNLNNKVKRK